MQNICLFAVVLAHRLSGGWTWTSQAPLVLSRQRVTRSRRRGRSSSSGRLLVPRGLFAEEAWNTNVVLLDHVNLNHGADEGHEALRAFYVDLLGFALDPRKRENVESGRKTLWVNAGTTQLHLPEAPKAQTLDGCLTVAYESLDAVRARLAGQSRFDHRDGSSIEVRDPWGTPFRLVERAAADKRGAQPGDRSEALGIVDVLLYLPPSVSLDAVARFYADVIGAPTSKEQDGETTVLLRVGTSPFQTLSFAHKEGAVRHDDQSLNGDLPINNGVHLSLYLRDLEAAYRRAEQLGVVYRNHRFKRIANDLQEAKKQCMFRVIDVVDPACSSSSRTPLFALEHELRSTTNLDGSKYKSCPLYIEEV